MRPRRRGALEGDGRPSLYPHGSFSLDWSRRGPPLPPRRIPPVHAIASRAQLPNKGAAMRQCCAPGRCTWDPAHQYYSVPPRPLLPSPAPFPCPIRPAANGKFSGYPCSRHPRQTRGGGAHSSLPLAFHPPTSELVCHLFWPRGRLGTGSCRPTAGGRSGTREWVASLPLPATCRTSYTERGGSGGSAPYPP